MTNELLNAQPNSENIVLPYIIQPVSVTPRHCVLNYACTVCYIILLYDTLVHIC